MDFSKLVVPEDLSFGVDDSITLDERELQIPLNLSEVGVTNDNKVERLNFKVPAVFDGVNDLSTFTWWVNYRNALGYDNLYHVDDLKKEGDYLTFSWLTNENLYAESGDAHFALRAVHEDGRAFGTKIATLRVAKGLNTASAIYEHDYDFINQQFEELDKIKKEVEQGVSQIEGVKADAESARNSAENAKQEADRAEQTIEKAELAPAIKMIANGNNLGISDISARFHIVKGKLSSDTITDFAEKEINIYGKNLLDKGYSQESNGVTFTFSNGVFKCAGTATAKAKCNIYSFPIKKGKYIFSGCPKGGSLSTYFVQFYGTNELNSGKGIIDVGEGANFEFINDDTIRIIAFNVEAGQTVDFEYKPMIRLSDFTDGEFEPFKKIPNAVCEKDGTFEFDSIYPFMTVRNFNENTSMSVEYQADTKKYIQKNSKPVEPIEPTEKESNRPLVTVSKSCDINFYDNELVLFGKTKLVSKFFWGKVKELSFEEAQKQISKSKIQTLKDGIELTIPINPDFMLLYNTDTNSMTVRADTSIPVGSSEIICAYRKYNEWVGGCLYDLYVSRATKGETSTFQKWEKAKEFSNLFVTSGKDIDSFLFFTDPHYIGWTRYRNLMTESIGGMGDMYKHTPVSYCICGGDWLNQNDKVVDAVAFMGASDSLCRNAFKEFIPILGNHDFNGMGEAILSRECIDNLFFRQEGKSYFKYQSAGSMVYVFDTTYRNKPNLPIDSFEKEQLYFFADSLKADDNPHSYCAMHIITTSGQVMNFSVQIAKVIKAYNSRTTVVIEDKSYDFSGCKGTCHFMLGGHEHKDLNGEIEGVPYVLTTCTVIGKSESTYDLCLADYTNKVLHMVRVGDGNNRDIPIL